MLQKVAILALLVLPNLSFAAEPTGYWTGRVEMDFSKLPAKDRKRAESILPKIKLVLTFSKNQTYTSKISGSPDGKDHVSSGKWSQKGNAVTLTVVTMDSKPATNKSPQTFNISRDGKTMTFVMRPDGGGGKATTTGPSAKVVLKKIG